MFADIQVSFAEQLQLKRLEELAKGYMSNADLENAMMSLNRRCSGISRVYRGFWNVFSALERVYGEFHCG